jgi:lipid-A-disaccharide synthase-like uncharacterized protein
MVALLFRWLAIGFLGGVCFGIAFGVIASFFRNGPPMLQAITESWWWFAALGSCIGLGRAYSLWRDTAKTAASAVQ